MPRPEVQTSSDWTCAVPVLCAVHCAAVPLLVGVLPALDHSATAEWLLLWVSLVIAGVVVGDGLRVHRQWQIPGMLAVGFATWALSLGGFFEPLPEAATTVTGSLAVAGGLFWNARRSTRLPRARGGGAASPRTQK